MKNKHLAILLFASLVWLTIMPILGVTSPVLYGAGALATLIFGVFTLSRLYLIDKSHWFVYSAATVMFVFWSYAIIDTSGLVLLAPLYMVALIWAGIKLYKI